MKVNKKTNIIVSDLNSDELLLLLKEINKTPLLFRRQLDLPEYISFGNEIELNNLNIASASLTVGLFNDVHELSGKQQFVVKSDQTVDVEITTPILGNDTDRWDLFYDMYDILSNTGATIGGNTSCHVHYGTHMINTPHKLSLLLKTLVVFEPIIFKFGYGEDSLPRELLKYRENYVLFSPMMTPQRVKRFTDALDNFNFKNPGVMNMAFRSFLTCDFGFRPVFNFNNFDFMKLQHKIGFDAPKEDDHIEVRCNNGTLKPEIAQNYINLVAHIIWAVNEDRIDEKYIEEQYLKYKKKKYNFDYHYMIIENQEEGMRYNRMLSGFDNIRMDKALKLADMIFLNDIDKFYFLKQYLKLFNAKEDVVLGMIKK